MEPSYQEYGSTSESSETTEGDRTRHEQAAVSTVKQATTSSSERRRGEVEMGAIKPPKQNGGKAAKCVVKNVDITVSTLRSC